MPALPGFIQVFCSNSMGLPQWVHVMLRPLCKKPPHLAAGQAAQWGWHLGEPDTQVSWLLDEACTQVGRHSDRASRPMARVKDVPEGRGQRMASSDLTNLYM